MVRISSNRWSWGTGSVLGCAAVGAIVFGLGGSGRTAPLTSAPEKTTLSGIPVGGKSRDEVSKIAAELRARLLSAPLVIKYGPHREKTTAGKLGAACDSEAASLQVFNPPKEGLVESLKDRFTGPDPRDVPLPVTFSAEGVSKALMRFAIRIGAEPHEPKVTKVGGKFKIIPPRPGRMLDPEALAASLQKALDGRQLRARLAESLVTEPNRARWVAAQKPIELPALTRPSESRIREEDLKAITATLTSFSTGLGGSSRNRVENIRIACRAIDGKVLMPGDVFSYNDVVGPRVPGAGYKNAPVIVNGELAQGIAGGICQVSSTLYNAALLSDMKIVRRRHHAFPVHYLPAGRDATVVDGAIDFQFQNRFKHPVAIDAKVVGNKVQVNIYGHPDDRREVQILSSGVARVAATTRTISDPKLPKGRRVVEKRAKSGKRVTITRVVRKNGAEVRREVVSRDYYPAKAGVIRVGTREEPKKPAAAAPGEPKPEAAGKPVVTPGAG